MGAGGGPGRHTFTPEEAIAEGRERGKNGARGDGEVNNGVVVVESDGRERRQTGI